MNEVNAIDVIEETGEPYLTHHLRFWYDNCMEMDATCDGDAMRLDILDSLDKDIGGSGALLQFAGHGNFDHQLEVFRGPYEYASPEVEEDYLPQAKKLS